MNSPAIHDFLTPEGAILADPDQLESALALMWKRAAETDAGGNRKRPFSRVSVANLVVAASASQRDEILEVLAELAPQYPTRSIIVLVDSTPARPSTVRAQVSALCHLPQPDQPQVCAEQIMVQCGQSQDDLDVTVLPLLEADTPVMVWWTLGGLLNSRLQSVLMRLANRFIFEIFPAGFEPMLTALEDGTGRRCAVRDLGWYRIGRWREMLAGWFEPPTPERLGFLEGIRKLSIQHAATTVGAVDAIWLAAFMAGQLDWQPKGETGGAAVFHRNGEPIEVTFSQSPARPQGIIAIDIESAAETFKARCMGEQLHICGPGGVTQSLGWPPLPRSQALANALVGRQNDSAFCRAARQAAWLATLLQRS